MRIPTKLLNKLGEFPNKLSCKLPIIITSKAKYPLIPIAQTRGKLKEMHFYALAQRDNRESVSSNGFDPGGRSIGELWERVVKDHSYGI
jgi:hypothetical protein